MLSPTTLNIYMKSTSSDIKSKKILVLWFMENQNRNIGNPFEIEIQNFPSKIAKEKHTYHLAEQNTELELPQKLLQPK